MLNERMFTVLYLDFYAKRLNPAERVIHETVDSLSSSHQLSCCLFEATKQK